MWSDFWDWKDKVYVIGEAGLKGANPVAGYVEDKENPAYVVVGLDWQVDLAKICHSKPLAIQKGAQFYRNQSWPQYPDGTWSCLRGSLHFWSSNTGKPVYIVQSIIMDKAVEHLGLKREELLMVGDNYLTDIRAGDYQWYSNALWRQVLPAEVADLPIAPTHVVSSLAEWNFEN